MNRLGHLRSVDAWERAEGSLAPLGATWLESEKAWNFALYSRHATGVTLLLYGADDFVTPVFRLCLDPLQNKTGRVSHCFVPRASAPEARYYAYRVEGPWAPEQGHRFDAEKILFDPYAEALFFPPNFSREAARRPGANDGRAPLGVLPRDEPAFNWGGAPSPRHTQEVVVYELHVKGFTARANSGVTSEKRGTFAGLIEKIP
jgi:isoamylase